MTENQYIGAAVLALLVWFFAAKRPAPAGTVDIGTPTVSGSGSDTFGGTDYAVKPSTVDVL
jgi:hypothetical protein